MPSCLHEDLIIRVVGKTLIIIRCPHCGEETSGQKKSPISGADLSHDRGDGCRDVPCGDAVRGGARDPRPVHSTGHSTQGKDIRGDGDDSVPLHASALPLRGSRKHKVEC